MSKSEDRTTIIVFIVIAFILTIIFPVIAVVTVPGCCIWINKLSNGDV